MGSTGKNDNYTTTLNRIETKIFDDDVETAVVLDLDGSILVDKSEGRKDAVAFTQEEAEMMKDKVITHNHPSSSTFSVPDVNLLLNRDAKEIRAVGSNGSIFRLVRMII